MNSGNRFVAALQGTLADNILFLFHAEQGMLLF
jgi:hypothetical protein